MENTSDIKIVQEESFFNKNKKKIGIGAVVIVALIFIVYIIPTFRFKKELKGEWSRMDESVRCVLDFSDDEIEYRVETSYKWLDTTIDTFDYKVISGNKIKVRYKDGDKWETISVELNDEKTMMTVKPALTSVDDIEYWFKH